MDILPPARKPLSPRVGAVGIAGSATVIVVWLLSLVGVHMPGQVASALTTLIGAAAGYMARSE